MFIEQDIIKDFKYDSKEDYNQLAQQLELVQTYSKLDKWNGTELMRELNHPEVRQILTCTVDGIVFPKYVKEIYLTYKGDTLAMIEVKPYIEDKDEQILATNYIKLKKIIHAYNSRQDLNFYRAKFVRKNAHK